MSEGHLTDVHYWDRTWSNRPIPDPLDPVSSGLNGALPRSLHRFFRRAFGKLGAEPGDLIVEAGSGGSVILPYFSKHFGLRAEGIENSPVGTQASHAIAAKCGVETPIHSADLFDLPPSLLGRYDIVFSYGLVEHFRPTTLILDPLQSLARQQGHLLTVIPNMRGITGYLQKHVNPEIYAIHVPLSIHDLVRAHQAAGMTVIESGHIMSINLGIVNFLGTGPVLSSVGPRLASWISKGVWAFERFGLPELPNGLTSPYIYVIAQKGQ